MGGLVTRCIITAWVIVGFGFRPSEVAASGESPGVRDEARKIGDFGLFDHRGDFHRLHYYADDPETRALVLFVQGNGCPLVRKRIPALRRLQARYASQGVRFAMINVNLQDDRDEVFAEARKYDISMPILIDDTQFVGRALKLTRTAEVLVIDPSDWRIAYRGAIDDQLDYETTKREASRGYLAAALDALLEGRPISMEQSESPGCLIAYDDPPSSIGVGGFL